jgi:hypothetical protein
MIMDNKDIDEKGDVKENARILLVRINKAMEGL